MEVVAKKKRKGPKQNQAGAARRVSGGAPRPRDLEHPLFGGWGVAALGPDGEPPKDGLSWLSAPVVLAQSDDGSNEVALVAEIVDEDERGIGWLTGTMGIAPDGEMIEFLPGEQLSLGEVLVEVSEERADEIMAVHCQALQNRLMQLGRNAEEIPGQDRDWLEWQVDFAARAVEGLAIDLACAVWVQIGDDPDGFDKRRVLPIISAFAIARVVRNLTHESGTAA